ARDWGLAVSQLDPSPETLLALSQIHRQRRTTIQAARFFTRVLVLRPLLTIADRPEAVFRDAAAHEVVLHSRRAPIAEREVVLGRADVAGVPFDLDPKRRRLAHRANGFVQDARRFRPQRVAVEVEVDILEGVRL